MNNNPSREQKMAIQMVDQLTETVVANQDLREKFCTEIRNNILSKSGVDIASYGDILMNTLSGHSKIGMIGNFTMRNTTRNILKTLTRENYFTIQEKEAISRKVKQGGGHRGVLRTQEVQNLQIVSEQEKHVLNEIYKNGDNYKRGSTRDIQKIIKFLEETTGIKRQSMSAIKHYLYNLNTQKKETIGRNDSEEISTLKDLFEQNYIHGKKLPIEYIVDQLNQKHKNNRSKNSVECYIRTHIKTADQKVEKTELRSDKEKTILIAIIQDMKDDWNKYINQIGKHKGSYNRKKIYEEYKTLYPETTRSARAIEHQIKKIKKTGSHNANQ